MRSSRNVDSLGLWPVVQARQDAIFELSPLRLSLLGCPGGLSAASGSPALASLLHEEALISSTTSPRGPVSRPKSHMVAVSLDFLVALIERGHERRGGR